MSERIYGHNHIAALTGLRAVGALLVVFYHYHKTNAGSLSHLFGFGGGLGVSLFFALSGYILTLLYAAEFGSGLSVVGYANFILKRIARIYPLHVFLLFLCLFLYPKFPSPGMVDVSGPRQLLLNLTLTQAWNNDPFSFIEPSWSISIEFFFYLIFPLLMLMASQRLAFIVFGVLASFYALVALHAVPIPPELQRFLNHRVFVYGAFFVLGACVHLMAQHRLVVKFLDNNLALAAMLIFLICLPYINVTRYAFAVFVIPLLVRSAHTTRLGNYLLGGSVMVLLGELSYSIYLSHGFIHQMVLNLARGLPMRPLTEWGGTYILLFIWCIFCYHVIEVPARNWIRNLEWKKNGG